MSGTTPYESTHVPFSEHWAVLNKNARHVEILLLLIRERRFCSTLHFVYIFLVFRWHNLQRPCGPVPRLWFTPPKRMSDHCDIKPDAALPGAVPSEYSKLRTTCRRNSRRLCGDDTQQQAHQEGEQLGWLPQTFCPMANNFLIVGHVHILLYFHKPIAANRSDGYLCTHVWLSTAAGVFCRKTVIA
ncbi:hypothetical protein T06_6890 [Trichinella sp. T6]|nr:hypothetical protein T06_6890 [Trichinella sp. T6]